MKTAGMIISMILMFITGLLLWDVFDMEWEYIATIQAVHIIGSVAVSAFFVFPFVQRHIYEYLIVKKIYSKDGYLLTLILFLILLSGVYLFLVGNRGGDTLGLWAFYIHLYGSFFLLLSLIYHIKKQKIDSKIPAIAIAIAMSVFYPAVSRADDSNLTLLKLEENVSRYHNEDWTNSAKCKSCHSDIFNQWADSNHKNMAGSNPYYMVMETLAGEVEGQEFRRWCMGCHNPSALTTGLEKTTHGMDGNIVSGDLFEKGASTLIEDHEIHGNARLEEGVSCVLCHRITKAEGKGNASYELDLTNREKVAFEDSDTALGHWMSEKFINSKPEVHKESYMKPLYKESKYCGSCHDEFSPKSGMKIVSTFKEWEKSPFNKPNDPTKHKNCIDCHMTYLQNGKFAPLKGHSTDGGKLKDDVKVHYFAGSNHFLSGLKNKVHEDQTIQLLKTAAELDVDFKEGKLVVGVKNVGAGHHLPTGVADFRELWLDVTLKDADGNVVFSSGKLKDDGNLGPDARLFMKVFGDDNGEPVGLLFWKYKKLLSDTRIPAGERRAEIYEIDTPETLKYPLTATVKLNFRIYPQWVTDAVRKLFPLLPNPPVVELEQVSKSIQK